jgi:hypothetical protein
MIKLAQKTLALRAKYWAVRTDAALAPPANLTYCEVW